MSAGPDIFLKHYKSLPAHPLYGESKLKGELLVKKITEPVFKWVIIRPTSIWGPWFGVPYIDFFNIVYEGRYFDFRGACLKTHVYVENIVFQIESSPISDITRFKTMYKEN